MYIKELISLTKNNILFQIFARISIMKKDLHVLISLKSIKNVHHNIKMYIKLLSLLTKNNNLVAKIFARISIMKKDLHVFKSSQSFKKVYQVINFINKKKIWYK
jgi:hypothetical protein